MNKQFEAAVKRVSLDKGYSDNDATMQFLLERRSDGAYCTDWVAGMHLGWIARGAADSERPEHAEWHQFTRGEWLVDSRDRTICIVQDGQEFTIASMGCIDVLEIACGDLNAKFYYGPESVANAYLMRAAPQMLRALESLVDWRAKGPSARSQSLEEAQKAINSALMRLPNHNPETDGDAAEFEAV